MKNFTNNFKQFTSRLSARWLIMALMMLAGTSSAWAQTWCLAGSFNGWSDAKLSSGKLTVDISSAGEYEFKIKQQGTWDGAYSADGSRMERNNCSDWQLYTNKGNSKFYADVAGSYTFTFNSTSKKLSITYPPQCSSCCNNNYVAGTADLTGYEWDPGQNQMTCSNNLYSKTFTNVPASTHQFKITNGSWGWSTNNITTKSGSNYLSLSQDGGNIKFTTTSIYNITIYFDGSGCYATYESACDTPAAPTLNPNSTTVCSGTSFDLPSGYRWYTVDEGGTKLTSNTISNGVTEQTIYYAEAGEDGCVSTSRTAYTVNVDAKPALTLESNPTICQGDQITLSEYVSSSSGTVKWYSNSNRTTEITNPSVARTPQSNPTYYYARATSGVCSSVDKTLTVTLSPQPAITLKAAPTICEGTTITFENYVNTSSGTVTWHTKSDYSDAAIATATPSQTTTYYAKATSGNCDPATVSLKVTVKPRPKSSDFNFTIADVNYDGDSHPVTVTWKNGGGNSGITVLYNGNTTAPINAGIYTVTVTTVENNTYCETQSAVELGSFKITCKTPAKPSLSSTAITACNGECTAQGYITINNMNDYKDDTYTFKLGSSVVTPDANGRLGINSTAYTQYTVTVTNSCGNQNSANVEIAINNITPTISGETFTQPGKAIELTVPTGITAEWTVSPAADLSVTEGNSTMFSAETNGKYTITATNGTCSATHVVTVADAFYIWVRNAKESDTAYGQFYYPNENSEAVRGGEMFYAECDNLPTNGNTLLDTHYKNYNKGGRKADLVKDDCDGYTWYGFKASADVIAGTKYFYVHATNDLSDGGFFTHTVPTKVEMTGDVYYTLCEKSVNDCNESHIGWKIVSAASAPYSGPKVHASGDAKFNANNFADFVSLYVTDCSGNEVTGYQWSYTAPTCTYIGKETVTMSASASNNIRVREAGNYTCTVKYKDGTTATSPALTVSTGATNTPALAEFTSNLPIIMVNTNGVGFPDCTGLSGQTASKNASTLKEKRSVDVIIKDGNNIIYDRKARMNYRGSSSLNFVKKSYAFCPGEANCEEKDGKADYVKTAKLNMLGLGDAYDKDWVLYAAAADPSLMRNRLVFDSYAAMTGEWGVNSRYVELIVDGEYKGVYVFMDKITMNKNRVKVDEDKGFIVKFDKTDKEDRVGGYNGILGDEKTFKTSYTGKDDIGTYDTSIDQRFEIEYPEKDDYTTGWKARVDGIQGMFQAFEDALKQGDYATVQKYIDYTSWADWFIINEFTKNVDAYRASCIFVYTGEAGAKIEARPLWDQELSFNNQASLGTNNKGCNSTTGLLIQHSNVYSDAFGAPFWFTGGGSDITGGLLSDPCFVQVVKERWNMHQFGALSKKSLEDLVDEYEDDLAPVGTIDNAKTRETAFWNGKSRGTCDCSYDTGNATATGYQNKTFAESTGTITSWIADGAGGRREGLTTAINGLTGASFSIQIVPSEVATTPWEPVEIAVSVTPAGYDYKLEYTDYDLGSVANTIIKEEGDKITYRIPRPSDWGVGDGARDDIEYGIKATLNVQDGTTVCGSQAAPSSTGKIILQDEPNDNCE